MKLRLSFIFFSRASDFGLVKIDSRGRVVQFAEKPKGFDLKTMVGVVELFSFMMCADFFLHVSVKSTSKSIAGYDHLIRT